MKICFSEEGDSDFIRWVSNLLRTFLDEGSVTFVKRSNSPDLMLASVWRKHEFPPGLPVILVSNECWSLFKPHAQLPGRAGSRSAFRCPARAPLRVEKGIAPDEEDAILLLCNLEHGRYGGCVNELNQSAIIKASAGAVLAQL